MNLKKLETYCTMLHASFHFPLYIYVDDVLKRSYSISNSISPSTLIFKKLNELNISPSYTISDSSAQYGRIQVSKNIDLIIGPIFSNNPDENTISQFAIEHGLSPNQDVISYLDSSKKFNFHEFLNILAYITYSITGTQVNILEHFNLGDNEIPQNISKDLISKYNDQEEYITHGTYIFERQLIDLVKYGSAVQLNEFIFSQLGKISIIEGKLAFNPLRQAKNLFIGTVTMIGKDGAIPGGVDIEETYRLIDSYIQQCERLTNVGQVKTLQYNMLIDFTNRVSLSKITNDVSHDTSLIIEYIQTHILEKIHLIELADHIGRSVSYITNKFQDDTGFTIGKYIIDRRLELSKNLLQFSTKSLVEISTYLSFSSQSYFQNCFKKKFGTTPYNFRKRNM